MSQLREWFLPILGSNDKLVYISGPMSGYEEHNKAAFDAARDKLQADGYRVCSPVDTSNHLGHDLTHEQFLRFDFHRVLEADFVVALDGWEQSKGATAEILMAVRVGTKVWRWSTWSDYDIIKEEHVLDALGALYGG